MSTLVLIASLWHLSLPEFNDCERCTIPDFSQPYERELIDPVGSCTKKRCFV